MWNGVLRLGLSARLHVINNEFSGVQVLKWIVLRKYNLDQ
jgi:hypothetical protein